MINDIVDGISEKLNEVFGDDYEIYTEQVKQGLQEPCFFISCVNPSTTPMLGTRHLRRNLFSVKYFPQSATDAKAECLDAQDELFAALEYITVDGKLVRGTNIGGEFVDDVLVCTVNYNIFVRRDIEQILMETLEMPPVQVKG